MHTHLLGNLLEDAHFVQVTESQLRDLALAIYRAGNFFVQASLVPITEVNDLALRGSRPFSGIL